MSDNFHVYSGIFVDEKGQRFLQILEASVDSVFEEVYAKTMPQNPNLFKECLSRVSAWDRSVIQEEMQKMKVYIDSDDVFKDAYVSYVKSMRASSQKKILINLPHFNEFLQQYWKRVADSRVMQSGRFFNGNAIDRKIICMDAARDILYSFLNDDTVTLEDKSDVEENDSYAKDQYDLVNKHTNLVPEIPLSKPLSHVSLSKSLRPENVPPFFRGNDDIGENDSIITPNDSISQINVATSLQKKNESSKKQRETVEEENYYDKKEEPKNQTNVIDNSYEPKEYGIRSEDDNKMELSDNNEPIQNDNEGYKREEKQKEITSRQKDMHRHEGSNLNEHRSETYRDYPLSKEDKPPPSVVSLSTISLSDNGKITMKQPSSSVSHKSSSRRHERKSRKDDDETSSEVSGYDQHKDRVRHKKKYEHEENDSKRERERNDSPESDVRSSHRKQIYDKNYDNRSSHSISSYKNNKTYAASEASNSDCTTSSVQNYRSKYNINDNVSEASSVSQSNHSRVQVKPKKSCLSHISDNEENSESD